MNVKTKSFSLVLVVLAVLLLSGCASMPNSTVEKIDHRMVEFAMVKHDTIPVIFEHGLAGRMENWKEVVPEISKDATTFVYNRPGYGKSDPVSTTRDGSHIVDELRTTLRSKGLNPPYILVGHSLGGLYMQHFARQYPDEVGALILVDSTHPRQFEGEGALEKQALWVRGLLWMMVTGSAKQELEMLSQTGQQVLALPAPTNKPVFILSASKPLKVKSPLADDANEKRKDIARLYPGSKQIWVDSGHVIPLEKPEAVIAAIHEALSLNRTNGAAAQ